ncbi:hypothetical protein J4772_10020 [Cohnella sp. LGH]|uniref:hypothetical protein n=1 Tax=Cohnella sp. LGH TaxID=1619153 RepID=UPI001ADB1FBB|nr:hypothetical protein [Cohnella sp. LGH]QTH44694.1 hypothetical protein J4772_10020 [Cohnella sp. LGH]
MIPFLYELIEAKLVTGHDYPLRVISNSLALLIPTDDVQVKLGDRTYDLRCKQMIGLMLVALFVMACGTSTPASEQATPVASSAAPSESAEAEATTKKVAAPLGEIEIPTHPVKIVTDGYLPELLVLGVKRYRTLQATISFWLPMPAQRMPLANCWTAGCGNPSTPLKTIVSIESTSINFCLTIRSSR